MKEIWKDIPGYEGLYQASTLWSIRSLNYRGRWKPWNRKFCYLRWYLRISLHVWGTQKAHQVHRLVLLTFKGESELQCNHINWIKDDNRLENLEYCTRSENQLHRFEILGHKWIMTWKFWNKHHGSKKVNQYTLDWEFIKTWDALSDVERNLWVDRGSITKVCKWKRNKC